MLLGLGSHKQKHVVREIGIGNLRDWMGGGGFLILVAFITGNSSLEPLIEGLYAE